MRISLIICHLPSEDIEHLVRQTLPGKYYSGFATALIENQSHILFLCLQKTYHRHHPSAFLLSIVFGPISRFVLVVYAVSVDGANRKLKAKTDPHFRIGNVIRYRSSKRMF